MTTLSRRDTNMSPPVNVSRRPSAGQRASRRSLPLPHIWQKIMAELATVMPYNLPPRRW